MTRVYQIEGMHCQSCAQNIQRRLETMPGITSAQVSFEDRKAYVSMAPVGAPADAQVERIVEEAGYTATPATQPVP